VNMLTLSHAFQVFLAQPTFAARTRESYAEDLAPLMRTLGEAPISALTSHVATEFLAAQEHLAASTYNRRLATLRSFVRWLQDQSWLEIDPLEGSRRRPLCPLPPRALNAEQAEATLRTIEDPRDRTLFWLIYEGALRANEALSLNIEDIDWTERSIRIHGKGSRLREMFFSRDVSKLLAKYLKTRGDPTCGPLFVTHRKARAPRHADLSADGYARLSYRQADTLWKQYTPNWDLHQLRHTAISIRAANSYTEVDLKRFSGHQSLRSLERYIADNREAAKRKAREWERRQRSR
jgi:integrase